MSNSIVPNVYSGVIKDVIQNVKKDFEDNGVDESVLMELERIWDKKIRGAKVALWEAGTNGLSNDDINQNSDVTNISHHQHPPPQSDSNQKYQPGDVSVASLPSRAISNTHSDPNSVGRPPHNPIKNVNVNTSLVHVSLAPPSSASPDISNRSSSAMPINIQTDVANASSNKALDQKFMFSQGPHSKGLQENQNLDKLIPRNVNNNIISHPTPQHLPEFSRPYAESDDINSDLDDSDEETNAEGEETQNIILCLYDKVTRTKNKWKCQLKDGIMSVNGRDYLFQKGNGDFEF
ncbi:6138_t:CDS:2 [Funneliformis mosseae]|uniref:Transcription initiation factor IIA large subunit n=1 Tax=Funneliformis mosseae TaxID=27381 RepID=A0A9N8Z7E8_FUNMO|nr:6138_t:CDS:2 [Funneliformis mosseae]